MHKRNIIGICGKKFNGKDTIGAYLINKYGYEKLSFAEPLKTLCKNMFEFNDEQVNGNQKEIVDEFWKITPRQLMQFIGTDLFRKQMVNIIPSINEENIWIKCLELKIKKKIQQNSNIKIVITDVRFQNEINFIKSLNNSEIWKVEKKSQEYNDEHESEKNIDLLQNIDITIMNNDSINDLYYNIDQIMK